jgi:hypothetical protein
MVLMALDPNMSVWIGLIVTEELQECCKMLQLSGDDRKVFEMCMKDFWDFVGYLQRNHIKVETEPDLLLDGKVIGSVIEIHITEYGLVQSTTNSTQEVAEFIHMFVQSWWKKYHQRIKIVFDMPKQATQVGIGAGLSAFGTQEWKEMVEAVTDKFVQYGEICGPSILAESLLRTTVLKGSKNVWKLEDKINLMTNAMTEAKHMAYLHGPLIFIKPDKRFFTRLREWRDSDASKII